MQASTNRSDISERSSTSPNEHKHQGHMQGIRRPWPISRTPRGSHAPCARLSVPIDEPSSDPRSRQSPASCSESAGRSDTARSSCARLVAWRDNWAWFPAYSNSLHVRRCLVPMIAPCALRAHYLVACLYVPPSGRTRRDHGASVASDLSMRHKRSAFAI